MRIENISQKNFKGYDVARLRGFYMQGLYGRGQNVIYEQMLSIAKKEGLDLYLNSKDKILNTIYEKSKIALTIWGQDCVTFLKNKGKAMAILSSEKVAIPDDFILTPLDIYSETVLPRGGNYYLGYKGSGERWMLINSNSLCDEENLNESEHLTTRKHIEEIFGVKLNNIFELKMFNNDDLDEAVRPIRYPYILVNDWDESLKNIEDMIERFPYESELYDSCRKYILDRALDDERKSTTEEIFTKLKEYGFLPIKIAGRYHYDINYLNALAWENKEGNLSYLTNSVQDSYEALMYLENLFDKSLNERVGNIGEIYHISGGPRTSAEINSDSYSNLTSPGFYKDNVIMDLLAVREGGIHCLTAEIPQELFEK